MAIIPFQQDLLDRVELALEEVRNGGNSVGIALVGPSGSGKTHAFDLIAERYPASGGGRKRRIPLTRSNIGSVRGQVGMARLILQMHGVSADLIKRIPDPETAANDSIAIVNNEIFLLEEMGDGLTRGERKFRAGVASGLKWLWNASPADSKDWTRRRGTTDVRGRVIVVSGTSELEVELHRNPELDNRFEIVSATYVDLLKSPELFRDVALDIGRRCGLPANMLSERNGRFFVALFLATAADLRKVEKVSMRATLLHRRHPTRTLPELLNEAFRQTQSDALIAQGIFDLSVDELEARLKTFQLPQPEQPNKEKRTGRSTGKRSGKS